MDSTLRSHESEKEGEKHPYRRFALPKTRNPEPSSYFPNSFSLTLVNNGMEKSRDCSTPRPE
jgi:hypothetical protein